jgi:hypothetical protein
VTGTAAANKANGLGKIDVGGDLSVTGGDGVAAVGLGGAASVRASNEILVGGDLLVTSGEENTNAGGAAGVTIVGVHGLNVADKGVDSLLQVTGDIGVESKSAAATIAVTSGNAVAGGDAAGGAATVQARNVNITAGAAAAQLNIVAGTASGVAVVVADAVGGEAKLKAVNLSIEATGAAAATVNITGGAGTTTNASGGDAVVDLAGDLTIKGANGAIAGAATLVLNPGAATGTGTAGIREVTVDRDLSVISGDGVVAVAAGGTATLIADDVKVGRALTVKTGAQDTNLAGAVTFTTTNLKAPIINLENKGGSALAFTVASLDVDENDTEINLDSVTTGATIATVNLGEGYGLSINAAANTDILTVTTMNVAASQTGRLSLGDHRNLTLTTLNVGAGATFVAELPTGFGDGDIFLTTGTATFGAGSALEIGGDMSGLAPDDEFTVINATTTLTGFTDRTTESVQGLARLFGFSLVQNGNAIDSTVKYYKANPRVKALSEGIVAGQAFLNLGTDLIADAGMSSALSASAGTQSGPAFFGAVSYGSFRHETGSHVKVDGFSIVLGPAYAIELTPGRLTLGAFFEYGDGSYDTYNDFANYASVHGDGDTSYAGGGLLGRMDFANHGSGSFYVELSARAGQIKTDFSTLDFLPFIASYDLSATYYGVHAGLGHVFNLSESTDLDLYSKSPA